MKNDMRFCVLREEAGEAGDAGGESHEAAAANLFGEGEAPPAGAGKAGGEGAAAPKAGEAAGKPADGQAAAGEEKKDGSLFSKMGKKGDAAPAGAKPAEGAPADLPEDKILLGDKASGDAKTHFATLKGITKNLRGEISAREARIKELEAKTASGAALPADYEKLKTEHKAFSERIAVLDLRNHPDFRRQFTEPQQKVEAALKAVLGDNKVEGVDIAGMLGKPRAEFAKAMAEAAEKLPDYERDEFKAGIRQLYQLAQSEREALGKSSELAKELQARTLGAQREAFGQTWEKLGGMEEFLVKIEASEDASPEDKAAIAAYNAGLDTVRANAEKLAFEGGGETGVAQTAIKAASFDFFTQHAYPRLEAEFKSLVEINRRLADEVKALRGTKGEGGSGAGGEPAAGELLDHDTAAKRVWGE